MTTVSIPLTRGKIALIDEEDFPLVGHYSWQAEVRNGGDCYATRRVQVNGKSKRVYLHRVVMNAADGLLVDHVSGNTLDCRKENLRFATHTENVRNRRKRASGTHAYKGIYQTPSGHYRAQIRYEWEQHKSRTFDTPEEAARAYDEMARRYFGEFARLNFP